MYIRDNINAIEINKEIRPAYESVYVKLIIKIKKTY